MKITGLACVVFNAICGAPIDEVADDVGGCGSREPQAIALSAMAMIRTYLIELQAPIIAPRASERASERATRPEGADEAASDGACRGVRGAKPLGSKKRAPIRIGALGR